MTDKYYILLSNITSNSKNQFKKASRLVAKGITKVSDIFESRKSFSRFFFSLPVSKPNRERDCKDNRLSANLQKLFQELRISLKISGKTISSSFIVNSRLICKNRCFSNADAKVATFSESASIRSSFFVKIFIISQQRGLYIYIIYKPNARPQLQPEKPAPGTYNTQPHAGMPHNIPHARREKGSIGHRP
ncbi:hypothetical protein [uncultured Alistipes sp.]|uniref:hypothetical protein n=1 Tax=uncultured Alistipes sp. TaxID=538949 RepID=UPI00266D204E|nr:hypothetical protein [uncultured Alistipes sp.]